MKKRILIFDRVSSKKFPGGDTVQINAIKDFLIFKGHYVHLSTNPLENLNSFDYIFIFNLTNPLEAYLCASAALRYNKPYIVFPVYWNIDSLEMSDNLSVKYLFKKFLPQNLKDYVRGRSFVQANASYIKSLGLNTNDFYNSKKVIKFILNHAYFICPNSHAEWAHLEENFGINRLNNRVEVVYNGINLKSIKNVEKDDAIKKKYNLPERYICCVGGIGPRKNQLNLVRAANKANINLVIIGQASKGYEKYYKHIRKIAKKNIYFLGQLLQEETFKILKNSVGHVQPSYIETPGLASLEAVALGVPIIVSHNEPVKEYFEGNALYCNPKDIDSLADALVKLSRMEKLSTKDMMWIQKYEWGNALKKLNRIL